MTMDVRAFQMAGWFDAEGPHQAPSTPLNGEGRRALQGPDQEGRYQEGPLLAPPTPTIGVEGGGTPLHPSAPGTPSRGQDSPDDGGPQGRPVQAIRTGSGKDTYYPREVTEGTMEPFTLTQAHEWWQKLEAGSQGMETLRVPPGNRELQRGRHPPQLIDMRKTP